MHWYLSLKFLIIHWIPCQPRYALSRNIMQNQYCLLADFFGVFWKKENRKRFYNKSTKKIKAQIANLSKFFIPWAYKIVILKRFKFNVIPRDSFFRNDTSHKRKKNNQKTTSERTCKTSVTSNKIYWTINVRN